WWLPFPLKMRPQLQTCIALRFIREATNVLLPLAQIGGDLVGAGLPTPYAIPAAPPGASVLVHGLARPARLFPFAVLGSHCLIALIAVGGDATLAWAAALGLGFAGTMLAGFYFGQRRGGQRILHFVIKRLTGDRKWGALGTVDAVYQNLSMIYAVQSDLIAGV